MKEKRMKKKQKKYKQKLTEGEKETK